MTQAKIINAWSNFAKELVQQECPELALNCNFAGFGKLMYSIVRKHGAAESVLWSGKVPTGTEDRTWVRTWLYMGGHTKYAGILQSLDGAHAKRCHKALRAA